MMKWSYRKECIAGGKNGELNNLLGGGGGGGEGV